MAANGVGSEMDEVVSCFFVMDHSVQGVSNDVKRFRPNLTRYNFDKDKEIKRSIGGNTTLKYPKHIRRLLSEKKACWARLKQEAQLMLTTGSTRLAVSRGQQIWYHSTCNI